ncbi:MAG: MBL fold metallo-hydrolase [Candidatus Omnitrophota bacterium]
MSRISITILGTTAGVPTRERAHAAIYMVYEDGKEYHFLFDCGEGTQRQLIFAGLNMLKLDDIFITHWHGDHCLGLPGVIDTMGFEERVRPLNIYAPDVTRAVKCLNFRSSESRFKIVPHRVPDKGSRISALIDTDRFSIISVPVKHSIPAVAYALIEKDKICVDSDKAMKAGLPREGDIYRELKEKGEVFFNGRRIISEDVSVIIKGKKIVYSGDTEICDNLKNIAEDADILIQDCTYFDKMHDTRKSGPVEFKEKRYQHASFPEVVEFARANNVKRTVLTHISRRYQNADELRRLVSGYEGFELASDFLSVVL